MKQVLIFLLLVWLALAANATPTGDFAGASALVGSGGFENPLLHVAFNPQPEPPDPGLTSFEDPTAPVFSVPLGDRGAEITLRTALSIALPTSAGAGSTFEPDLGAFEGNSFSFDITDASGVSTHGVHLGYASSTGPLMDPLTIIGFNPQPEPPALGFASQQVFGLDITFGLPALAGVVTPAAPTAAMLAEPFVSLTLRIEDLSSGTFLSFAPLPVAAPPIVLLILLGGAAVAALRRHTPARRAAP